MLSGFAPGDATLPNGRTSGALVARGQISDLESWTAEATLQVDEAANRPRRFSIPGSSRVRWSNGTLRVDGDHRVGGVAPASFSVRTVRGGANLPGRSLADTRISGGLALSATDVPRLLQVLRDVSLLAADTTASDGAGVTDCDAGGKGGTSRRG